MCVREIYSKNESEKGLITHFSPNLLEINIGYKEKRETKNRIVGSLFISVRYI
jgi:hypothetical protein